MALGGEMKNSVGAKLIERAQHSVRVANVAHDETTQFALQVGERRAIARIAELIENQDGAAERDQISHKVTPNKPRPTGDEISVHVLISKP